MCLEILRYDEEVSLFRQLQLSRPVPDAFYSAEESISDLSISATRFSDGYFWTQSQYSCSLTRRDHLGNGKVDTEK